MSFPDLNKDEKTYYPYYILFGYDQLPFKNEIEKSHANKTISDFIEIIDSEKAKSPDFAKKIEEIDFDVLLQEPNTPKWEAWKK